MRRFTSLWPDDLLAIQPQAMSGEKRYIQSVTAIVARRSEFVTFRASEYGTSDDFALAPANQISP
jgi:hypothetical protein